MHTKIVNFILKSTLMFPVFTFAQGQCDLCDQSKKSNNYLQTIRNNTTAIKNAIVSPPEKGQGKGQGFGNLITAYSALKPFHDNQQNVTSKQTDNLALWFQGNNDDDANANKAYTLFSKKQFRSRYHTYNSLSANALFGPNTESFQPPFATKQSILGYGPNQQHAANAYIHFLSGDALRPSRPSSTSSTDDKRAMNTYRTLAAVQSMGAYNLSQIYTNRVPNTLKNAGNGRPLLINNSSQISPNALVHYIEHSQVSDPKWLTSIATDSPMNLNRKTVYLLAGVFSLLNKMEQNQEQMLATQTATNTLLIAASQQAAGLMKQAQAATSQDAGDASQYIDSSDTNDADDSDDNNNL